MKQSPATNSESRSAARLDTALVAPLTFTVSGNIAAAIRFSAFADEVAVEEQIQEALRSFAHCKMTDLMNDTEAERWLAGTTSGEEGEE